MLKINKNNRIIYPSIFEIDYDKETKFNVKIVNDKLYGNIDKTKVFNLESYNICDLKAWNECFKIDNINYNDKIYDNIAEYLKSDEFRDLKIEKKKLVLKNGKITIDYVKFAEVCCDIQKVFSSTFNYVGENFSKTQLVVGNLQNYIFQYISNCIFGMPNLYVAIENLPEINSIIDSLPKKLIANLLNTGVLSSLYKDFIQEICTEEIMEKRCSLFRKKNVIEFSIFLKLPELNFNSSDALKNSLINEIVNLNIPDSLWKINFILN
tara:strand:- start:59 stop:856 length:798 start_codon:yes stop_codon:yes gene_type:complete